MKLTIFAATGGIGRQALEQAVAAADAVLSGLGPRSNSEAGIVSQGTRAIVQAMQATDVRRIVVVSAAPIGTVPSPGRPKPPKHDPGDGFFMRNLFGPLVKAALRKHYADLALMEDVLRDSDLDWTIVRPPRLTDGLLTGIYRTAYGRARTAGRPHRCATDRDDRRSRPHPVLRQCHHHPPARTRLLDRPGGCIPPAGCGRAGVGTGLVNRPGFDVGSSPW